MKSKTKTTLLSILTVSAILLVVIYYQLSWSDFQLINTTNSSNSKYIITEFRSNSEAGHAPYGTHLVLSHNPISNPGEGYIIYAGYCIKLNYTWNSSEQININCKSDKPTKVITLANIAYGINIVYNKSS